MAKFEVDINITPMVRQTCKLLQQGHGTKDDLKKIARACLRELYKRDVEAFLEVHATSARIFGKHWEQYKSPLALKRKREAEQRIVDEHNMKMKVERWEDDEL